MKTAPTSTISSSYYFWKLASFYRLWKHHFMNIEVNIPSPIHSHLKVIMVAIWHTLNKHYMNNMRIKKGEWTIQLMYILWSIIIAQQVRWWIPCQVPLAVSAQWNSLFKFGVKKHTIFRIYSQDPLQAIPHPAVHWFSRAQNHQHGSDLHWQLQLLLLPHELPCE